MAITVATTTSNLRGSLGVLERPDAFIEGLADARLGRMINRQDIEADVVIRNVGRREVGIRRMLNVIRDQGFVVVW
jgi:hypothetical protein